MFSCSELQTWRAWQAITKGNAGPGQAQDQLIPWIPLPHGVRAPDLSLNISCNLSIEPIHLAALLGRYHRKGVRFVDFRAQGCPRLAEPLESAGKSYNVLSEMANEGAPFKTPVPQL